MVLPITVYNQKGGQAKSTVTRDLAAVFAELGLDVLIVDFDSQDKSVSNYLGVDGDKREPDADHIARHLINQPKGDLADLIKTVPDTGIDVIPSHKQFGDVDDYLDRHREYLEPTKGANWEYPRYKRFFQVLQDSAINDNYDVMLVDPNAKADEAYYLALYATRNLVIPAEPNRAGYESIEAVKRSAEQFADSMGISISTLATVPMFGSPGQNKLHTKFINKIHDEYPSPVYFKDITAFENAESEYMTLPQYLESQGRTRSYHQRLVPKFRTLAASIYSRSADEFPTGVWTRDDLWLGDDHWDVDESLLPPALQGEIDPEVDQPGGVA